MLKTAYRSPWNQWAPLRTPSPGLDSLSPSWRGLTPLKRARFHFHAVTWRLIIEEGVSNSKSHRLPSSHLSPSLPPFALNSSLSISYSWFPAFNLLLSIHWSRIVALDSLLLISPLSISFSQFFAANLFALFFFSNLLMTILLNQLSLSAPGYQTIALNSFL